MEYEASYARLRHLESISEAALAHMGFDDLVDELLVRIRNILNADTAAVLLAEGDELAARAAKGLEEEVEAQVRVPIGRGFAGQVAAERRPIAIRDVPTADIYNPILVEKGLKSLLGAPLLVEGRVTGVVHVGTLTPREFSEDDVQLLQLAADRIALAIDHARLYEAERDAAEQLRRLESVTEAALGHLSLHDLLDVLLLKVREVIATDTAVVMLVDEGRGELVPGAALGLPHPADAMPRTAIGEGFAGTVAANARSIAVEDVKSSELVTPAIAAYGIHSLVAAPLLVAGRVTGVIALGSFEHRRFDQRDVDLLERAADRIALAIENARLYGAEREARAAAEAAADRIRRIESITQVALHHITLDDELLERLLTRVRDVLEADMVAVLVMDDAKQTLVVRSGKGGLEEEVERGVEVPLGRGFAGHVAELRRPVVVADAGDVDIVSPLLRERAKSLAGVPLIVEDRLLGVLHVGSREPRSFTEDDVTLLELAGERLAVALDHSRLYERERFVAETLQRSLLPERLPAIVGADVASRYLPGEGEAVGGDWYDVIPLSGGRVALAMGDVVSRGIRAASVMGQLRNALRAYAVEEHGPAGLLQRLDAMTGALEGRELATLVYAVLEPSTGEVVYATAGHPPPLVLSADGEVERLEDGRGPPLGALSDSRFPEARAFVPSGGTVVLYTDGVVERRDVWIDEGIERLSAELREAAGCDPDELLTRLTGRLLDGSAEDDVALLALRVARTDARRLSLELPAEPTVLASMRQALGSWLRHLGADADEQYDVLVATTEAAANAVEHAYGPGDERFSVEADALDGGEVSIVVRDRGQWRPARGTNRGRGTTLMRALMDDFEVATDDTGTVVRMKKRVAARMAA